MRNQKHGILALLILSTSLFSIGQSITPVIRIRTITAGITLDNLSDTAEFLNAVYFLKKAKSVFVSKKYEVQTLRIATQNFYKYAGSPPYDKTIPQLVALDRIAERNGVIFSIGQVIDSNGYWPGISDWAVKLIQSTSNLSFSTPISSHRNGIHKKSIQASAEIIIAISKSSEGGEGNFRFTASANCPAGIPFFPAAFHEGPKSFAIGLESPNLFTEIFRNNKANSKEEVTTVLDAAFMPIQTISENIGKLQKWKYDGIDVSPAPGLDASIGSAIEAYTGQPFGSPSTLSACAFITDVLKNLKTRKCGYSGLMLPVVEDRILAQRAGEGRYGLQELLLYSAVSGTGLDVVPLPGSTGINEIKNILTDVAALSLRYTAKALSARLFLIPGKSAGEMAEFINPHLTRTIVMKID